MHLKDVRAGEVQNARDRAQCSVQGVEEGRKYSPWQDGAAGLCAPMQMGSANVLWSRRTRVLAGDQAMRGRGLGKEAWGDRVLRRMRPA